MTIEVSRDDGLFQRLVSPIHAHMGSVPLPDVLKKPPDLRVTAQDMHLLLVLITAQSIENSRFT